MVVLLCGAVFLYLQFEDIERHKEVRREGVEVLYTANENRTVTSRVRGILEPARTVTVAFQVGGKLEKGQVPVTEGAEVKKDQLLFQINNREAYAEMTRKKTVFAEKMAGLMTEIEQRFPSEKWKWLRFAEELKPRYTLPEMPKFASSDERYFMMQHAVLSEFAALQQAELHMVRYFYLAPFDGIIRKITCQPGDLVRPNQAVSQLVQQETMHLTLHFPEGVSVEDFASLDVFTADSVRLGTATLLKGQSGQKQGKAIHYSFHPSGSRSVSSGNEVYVYLTYKTASKSCEVPDTAIDGDLVQVISESRLQTRRVTIVGDTEGPLKLVTGLRNGEAVLLHFRHRTKSGMRYYPVVPSP